MGNTEKKNDDIISETMQEFYDSIEMTRKMKEKLKEEDDLAELQAELDEVNEVNEAKETESVISEDMSEAEALELHEAAVEDEMIDEEKATKSKKTKKILLTVFGSILGILIVIYIGFAIFFNNHFMFNTTINGKNYSLKSAEAVAEDMELQVQEYALTIKESDGESEVIDGDAISLQYVPNDELKTLAASQNNILWITSLWAEPKLETKVAVQYDDAKLGGIIDGLTCMDPENQIASISAKPEFKETKFEITEEVIGTEINVNVFNDAVRNAIEAFEDTLDLSESQCYILPAYVSTSEEVIAACEKMNSYLGAEITYDLHPETEVVDASVISTWITVNKKMKVKFNEEKMREYLSELGKKYDTKGKERTFKSGNGNTVKVSGGSYGWLINEKEEFKQLKKDIQKGEKITREPVYYDYGRAKEHTATDWGNTYAEVDLTNQRMYFIKDGKVVLESPVVTGNPNKGNATPQGVYSLTYKARNAVLRGRRDENGVPEYETPVAFWMPFNGGIGFHDATWQSSFGGSRYRTNGSHGCINMPYSKAQELYNLIPEKCPVVCHY